ncbi:MAG: hypothetical protein RLZ55_924 [Actinomycetota bacterium]|jgi:hypothetical protein
MRPWARVGPVAGTSVADHLQPTIDATIEAIRMQVPSYRDFGSGPLAATVRRGVEVALGRLVSLFGTDDPALDAGAHNVYARIGAGEWRNGRTLEALLTAYRTGARVSWERMSAAAVAAGTPTTDLVALAEAIFVYIDELSAASAAGYAQAQSADAGRREAVRAELAAVILDGGGDSDAARVLAEEAAWPLPARVAVALAAGAPEESWPGLAVEALIRDAGAERLAVMPARALENRRTAESALELVGGIVCVGISSPLPRAAASLGTARRLFRTARAPASPERTRTAVLWADDSLPQLAAGADSAVVAALRARSLGPFADISEAKRTNLIATLQVWLVTGGDRSAAARVLGVHPQTVTYRVARLRELLGESLDDPQSRLELIVVLAAAGWPPQIS